MNLKSLIIVLGTERIESLVSSDSFSNLKPFEKMAISLKNNGLPPCFVHFPFSTTSLPPDTANLFLFACV